MVLEYKQEVADWLAFGKEKVEEAIEFVTKVVKEVISLSKELFEDIKSGNVNYRELTFKTADWVQKKLVDESKARGPESTFSKFLFKSRILALLAKIKSWAQEA